MEQIQHDNDRLYIEALLIRERILMPKKNYHIMWTHSLTRGEQLIKTRVPLNSVSILWEHTFYLYRNMAHATSLHRFVWVFCKMLTSNVPYFSSIICTNMSFNI